jgi:type III secretion system YscD/HrpQ family protein
MTAHPAPGWCLRFLSGALRGRTIALKPGANSIGSGSDCDVMLPGGDVLPRHLQITVGELVVSAQKLPGGNAQLNGEDMPAQRRSVLAGDVLSLGGIDFQLDRVQPHVAAAHEHADSMFAGDDPPAAPLAAQPALAAGPGRWLGGGLALVGVVAVLALAPWEASGRRPRESASVDLQEVERVLAAFPEVEAVAGAGGNVALRGYVESRSRQLALREAIRPFGARVQVSVLSADEMIEQARRFISDPGVSVAYAGHGRLVVSGVSEDENLRQQVRRLTEDLHPTVLVSDKVQYRTKAAARGDDGERARAQWAAWQSVLPGRLVGITEDGNGLRHIQLANGSRYYEGAVLRSGAELTRIDADGLVLRGGESKETPR